jgi:hypothetical protein
MNFAAIQSTLKDSDFEPRPHQIRIIEKCVNMFLGEHLSSYGDCKPPARSVMIETNRSVFTDNTPIRLSFSGKIGDIMKHVSDDDHIQTSYRYYM